MARTAWTRFIMALSILVVLVPNLTAIGVSAASAVVSTAKSSDLDGHWSEHVFVKWVNDGLIKGYPDGTYKPDKPVKRAELAAMINRAFKLTGSAVELPFTDLAKEHWAYDNIAIAYKAGYFNGANGQAAAERNTTRQEGAVMIAGILDADMDAAADLSMYKDGKMAGVWAQAALSTLSVKGILKGDLNGEIRPTDFLTRAEAITIIDTALEEVQEQVVYDKAGEYGSVDETTTIKGDVVIAVDGVTLVNTVIEGDLLLDKGIGEGDVYLKQVTVKGATTVRGGGENSVHVEDSVLARIIVDKASGNVRIVVSGSTEVKTVVIQSSVKLEELKSLNGLGFQMLELAKSLPTKSTVELEGQFENVNVFSTSVQIHIPSGSIANLEVGENSKGNEIKLGEEATIVDLVLNAIANLVGQGKIVTATLAEKAEGSTFETEPEKIEGPEQSGGATVPPVIIPGGGGGGPGPIVSPPAADQTTASLSAIQIGGSFSLVQRDANLAPVGSGFDKNVLGYSIAVDRSIAAINVPMTVTAESSATNVRVLVNYKDHTITDHQITSENKTFNVSLRPLEDVQVYIMVTSGNGLQEKDYYVSFQYDRNIQEAFLIRQSNAFNAIGPERIKHYLFSQGVYNQHDVVELYDASTDAFPLDAAILKKEGNLDWLLDRDTYDLQEEGRFYLKVKRDGRVIDEGYYEYSLAPISQVTEAEGLSVRPMTNQERADRLGTTFDQSYPYFFTVEFEPAEWAGTSIENAKYYKAEIVSSGSIYFELGAPMRESFKVDINPFDSNMRRIPREHNYGVFNFGDKTVYDTYVQLILFDEQYRPIGYYQQALEPGEEHVLPGHTIVHSIRPELNTDDQTPPEFTELPPNYLLLGESITTYLNEDANVYLVPKGTPLTDGRTIHNLVNGGTGIGSRYYAPNSSALLDTTGLAEGDWILVAVDRSGNVSTPIPLRLLDQLPIGLQGLLPIYNSGIMLLFSSEIKRVVEIDELKNNISISRDGSDNFVPLGENDWIQLSNFYLQINFQQPYAGNKNRIKITGGSLAGRNDVVMKHDWISPIFSEGTYVDMKSGSVIESEEDVVFTVDRPAKVYLIPYNQLGTGISNDSLVEMGLAKSVVIETDKVNQEIRLSTKGLAPGHYILYTVQGRGYTVDISPDSVLRTDQVALSYQSGEVSATVTGLKEGDAIRIFASNGSDDSMRLLQERIVPQGQNSVSLDDLSLNAEGGSLFFTLQSAGKGEGIPLVITYSSQEDNYQVIDQTWPVPGFPVIPTPVIN